MPDEIPILPAPEGEAAQAGVLNGRKNEYYLSFAFIVKCPQITDFSGQIFAVQKQSEADLLCRGECQQGPACPDVNCLRG